MCVTIVILSQQYWWRRKGYQNQTKNVTFGSDVDQRWNWVVCGIRLVWKYQRGNQRL